MHWYPFHRTEHHEHLQRTNSRIGDDGRVDISFPHHFFHTHREEHEATKHDEQDVRRERKLGRRTLRPRKKDFQPPTLDDYANIPRMNVAILITGSRGDVQPFIALGQTLQKAPYNHRVRVGTHPVFKDFVEENGLEFFSIGGDPSKLMAFMVKNPGIIPSFESFKAGEIGARKAELAEMMEGAWRACTEAGDGMTKIDLDAAVHSDDILLSYPAPFVADAIIANPPTYAHIHIAEKLAIPCHIMFTMPWSPTREFPHPLTNVDASKVDNPGLANLLSYKRMELLTWEGLSDITNHFREKTLHLDAVSPLWGHRLFTRLRVPFTYCWSEALIPKPADWDSHVTISGFFFLSLASSFKPDPDLKAFLEAGPPPIYIGFGSIVVDDPEGLTNMIYEAVKKAGVRALVSKGWGNVGGSTPPDNVFLLGNVPHDWLFPRVSAVVHHGGAGTNAIGIALGKPTVIVPFFGDQPFWANMVYKAGAGPEPVAFKDLTADKLAANIKAALTPEMQEKAHELAEKIKGEEGPQNAARAFHEMPQMKNIACFLCPDRVAVWRIRRTNIQLSSMAVAVLVTRGKLKPVQLKLARHKRWYVEEGSQDPIVAVLGALSSTATGLMNDVYDYTHSIRGKEDAHQGFTRSSRVPTRVEDQNDEDKEKHSNFSLSPSSSSEQDIEKQGHPVPRGQKLTPKARHPDSNFRRFTAASGDFVDSSVTHVAKLPVTLLYNLANGFHNAPSQLGDNTVRIRDPIDGVWSGMKVGSKELVFGTWDGFTGLVTQPYNGMQEGKSGRHGGPIGGLAKGVGLGLTGLVFKVPAAFIGPFGYGGKGMERSIQKWWTGSNRIEANAIAVIMKAKEEVKQAGFCEDEGKHAAALMWDEAKGAGVGKRMVERRVWQGYREVRTLRAGGDPDGLEEKIMQMWEKLAVDEEFLAGLMG